MRLLDARPLHLGASGRARSVGRADITDVSLGHTTITREVMRPGWRWSDDVKPLVGTDLCQAAHQMYVVSGRMRIVMDGAELDISAGDAAVVAPGHDAWVVGDQPCEIVDFSPTYSQVMAAAQEYRRLTDRGAARRATPAGAAARLRRDARAGRLDRAAVEIVLGSVGRGSRRMCGPSGLTPRETQVLALIATGASARQVAQLLGITPKTAATHIERIYAKAGVTSRAAATRFAIRHGLVDTMSDASPDPDMPLLAAAPATRTSR